MKVMQLKVFCNTLFVSAMILMNSCTEQELPEFRSNPYSNTKRINLIFVDKANSSANVAIYVNNRLLSTNSATGAKGLQFVDLPDSLTQRTLSLALAEFRTASPAASLLADDIIYESFILPDELATFSTIAFSRENPASPIITLKSGLPINEPAPAPGYFKVRFYNISANKVDVFMRDGTVFSEFSSLNSLEERPLIELPFGFYRFTVRRDDDNKKLDDISPILNGEAGKVYTIFCTDVGQVITELGDYGVPQKTLAYVGFVNLIPNGSQVIALPLSGSMRKDAEQKMYTKFDGVELVPSGAQTISVEVDGVKISANYDLKSYDYLMVYIVERNGKPEIQMIPTPMGEPRLDQLNARYLNFSGDGDTVTFARIRSDFELDDGSELPSNVLSEVYSANLMFGEIRTTENTSSANSVFTQYFINRSTNDSNGSPLTIQAFNSTTVPSRLGAPIPGTRVDFPFFINRPDQEVKTYTGYGGEPGIYTVILTGTKGSVDPQLRSRITIISHSF